LQSGHDQPAADTPAVAQEQPQHQMENAYQEPVAPHEPGQSFEPQPQSGEQMLSAPEESKEEMLPPPESLEHQPEQPANPEEHQEGIRRF
jgi:hypothetical protein